MAHGRYDDLIPLGLGHASYRRLAALGQPIEWPYVPRTLRAPRLVTLPESHPDTPANPGLLGVRIDRAGDYVLRVRYRPHMPVTGFLLCAPALVALCVRLFPSKRRAFASVVRHVQHSGI